MPTSVRTNNLFSKLFGAPRYSIKLFSLFHPSSNDKQNCTFPFPLCTLCLKRTIIPCQTEETRIAFFVVLGIADRANQLHIMYDGRKPQHAIIRHLYVCISKFVCYNLENLHSEIRRRVRQVRQPVFTNLSN